MTGPKKSVYPMLFKPIDIKELLQTISEMLRNEYEQRRRPVKSHRWQ